MLERFNEVCKLMNEAMELELRTEKVLDIMITEDKPMRASEISEKCGFYNYEKAIHPLKWLQNLGLVERYEVDGEPISVKDSRYVRNYTDGKPEMIEVDGVKYMRTDTINFLGHWEEYTRTIIPKVAMFRLVK